MAVSGFEHETGAHCGSASLRDLADYYGWGLDEAACFGVGAGLGFTFVRSDESPRRAFVGRSPWLESAALDHLGVGYVERSGESWAEAWPAVRAHLDAGRPVVAFVDLYYLDYYDTSTHFGPHTVVAVDADDEGIVLADSEFAGTRRLALDRFREAWASDHGFWGPLRNRWLVVEDPEPTRSVEAAFRAGVERAAAGMLDPDRTLDPGRTADPDRTDGERDPGGDGRTPDDGRPSAGHRTAGVPGIRAFADDLPGWADLPDASWCARFAYQNVEKRGTGGGAFRGLYAPFVEAAVERLDLDPALAGRARDLADEWTALGGTLRAASEADDPAALFERAGDEAAALADREAAFHRALLDAVDGPGG